jgi:uncharacterized membrane protein YccC
MTAYERKIEFIADMILGGIFGVVGILLLFKGLVGLGFVILAVVLFGIVRKITRYNHERLQDTLKEAIDKSEVTVTTEFS